MIFEITGNPIACARPRFAKGKVYDSQKELKDWVRTYLQCQINTKGIPIDHILSFEAYEVNFIFCFRNAERNRKKINELKTNGFACHSQKPDCDNLEKFYLDCCKGLFFQDDAQVIRLSSCKMYAIQPSTLIQINGLSAKDIECQNKNTFEKRELWLKKNTLKKPIPEMVSKINETAESSKSILCKGSI